jgi:DNA anti-recombination protein RmuC
MKFVIFLFQQQLVLLSEQCDKKLMQYRKEEREEISILKEEKRRLQQSIRHLTNQNQNLEANIQRVSQNKKKFVNPSFLLASRGSFQSI